MLVKENGGPKFLSEESDGFSYKLEHEGSRKNPPTIISEMDSTMSTCVEKGCKKEISQLIQLMELEDFEGDMFSK